MLQFFLEKASLTKGRVVVKLQFLDTSVRLAIVFGNWVTAGEVVTCRLRPDCKHATPLPYNSKPCMDNVM